MEAELSPALRDVALVNRFQVGCLARKSNASRRAVCRNTLGTALQRDPVLQVTPPSAAAPAVEQSFEGMNISEGCGNCLPPDSVGAVGPHHYVQMVNSSIAVCRKTGERLMGPKPTNGLWQQATTQTTCRTHNDSDPIVLYDQFADRWLVSQFYYRRTWRNLRCMHRDLANTGSYRERIFYTNFRLAGTCGKTTHTSACGRTVIT